MEYTLNEIADKFGIDPCLLKLEVKLRVLESRNNFLHQKLQVLESLKR